LLIGCSGWSHDDWVGRFYPVDLARRKEEWLRYYAGYFSTVEVNSTFARPPNEMMVSGWIRKAQALKGFEYSVRMPSLVTHDAVPSGDASAAVSAAKGFQESCVRPLADAGLLGAVLLQMPPREPGNAQLAALEATLKSLDADRFRYAVDFPSPSWSDGRGGLDKDAAGILRDSGVANVISDGPGPLSFTDVTAGHSYMRFHGREATDGSGGSEYLYAEDELRAWKDVLSRLKSSGDVRVYFSNFGRARGARNAIQLMDLMSVPHKPKEVTGGEAPSGGLLMIKR